MRALPEMCSLRNFPSLRNNTPTDNSATAMPTAMMVMMMVFTDFIKNNIISLQSYYFFLIYTNGVLLFVWKNELSANLFVDVYFFLYLCTLISAIHWYENNPNHHFGYRNSSIIVIRWGTPA